MGTGAETAFVLSWPQTRIDGRSADPSALSAGCGWAWRGQAVRLDGRQDVLVLGGSHGIESLRARAGRAVRRRLNGLEPAIDLTELAPMPEDFAVTDGRSEWPATVVLRDGAVPLLLFAAGLPPEGRDLWVSRAGVVPDTPRQAWAEADGLICFTPGTMIHTPCGERPVDLLRAGDEVMTRDSGAQPVLWTGRRRIGGGLLYALPRLRPVRIGGQVPGVPSPLRPLLLSPQHLVVAQGAAATALFGEPEVLVAAEYLPGTQTDHVLSEVTYIHFALPAHHVVWANGVPVETFHPARAAPGTLDAGQDAALAAALPVLDDGAWAYGPLARRVLDVAEAALLAHGLARRGALTAA
jgi:Hint domain